MLTAGSVFATVSVGLFTAFRIFSAALVCVSTTLACKPSNFACLLAAAASLSSRRCLPFSVSGFFGRPLPSFLTSSTCSAFAASNFVCLLASAASAFASAFACFLAAAASLSSRRCLPFSVSGFFGRPLPSFFSTLSTIFFPASSTFFWVVPSISSNLLSMSGGAFILFCFLLVASAAFFRRSASSFSILSRTAFASLYALLPVPAIWSLIPFVALAKPCIAEVAASTVLPIVSATPEPIDLFIASPACLAIAPACFIPLAKPVVSSVNATLNSPNSSAILFTPFLHYLIYKTFRRCVICFITCTFIFKMYIYKCREFSWRHTPEL